MISVFGILWISIFVISRSEGFDSNFTLTAACDLIKPVYAHNRRYQCSQPNATFSSTNYPNVLPLIPIQTWNIEVEGDHYIQLIIEDVYFGPNATCEYDYLNILTKTSENRMRVLSKICKTSSVQILYSDLNRIYIYMILASSKLENGRGFLARYVSKRFPYLSNPVPNLSMNCTHPWTGFQGSCYVVFRDQYVHTWLEASHQCERNQSSLVSITSVQESDFVYSLLIPQIHHSPYTYIGLNDRSEEGHFVWCDGSPMCYSEFHSGTDSQRSQPDGNDFEDCTMIEMKYLHRRDLWYDVTCAFSRYRTVNFICEKRIQFHLMPVTLPIVNSTVCPDNLFTCDDGTCIPFTYRCDGKSDCLSGSDEVGCKETSECGQDNDKQLMFMCKDGSCLRWSFVCDFITDCLPDGEDEQGCHHRSCLDDEFRCTDGQCINKTLVCDTVPDCFNESDELDSLCTGISVERCYDAHTVHKHQVCDGVVDCPGPIGEDERYCKLRERNQNLQYCSSLSISSQEVTCQCRNHKSISTEQLCLYDTDFEGNLIGCRDASHLANCKNFICPRNFVKCPGAYCIRIHKRCDFVWDCPRGEDEEQCEEYKCPGMFRCSVSNICLPIEMYCDKTRNCPLGEDEQFCEDCPIGCRCNGFEVQCANADLKSLASLSREVRYLDASGNSNISTVDLNIYEMLMVLNLSECDLNFIASRRFITLRNLRLLDLSCNKLTVLWTSSFAGLGNLVQLSLNGNSIKEIHSDAFDGLFQLPNLDLSNMMISEIKNNVFRGLMSLQTLNISQNQIAKLDDNVFSTLTKLRNLDISRNDIEVLNRGLFNSNGILTHLRSDEHAFCCFASQVPSESCFPKMDALSSCCDLISDTTLSVILWIQGFLALIGNVFVFVYRCHYSRKSVHDLLLKNLCASDLLMGVYLLIIACVDAHYRGRYVENAKNWNRSWLCAVCGILATLSSEVSVYVLTLMSVSRFVSITFPFSQRKVTIKLCRILLSIGWVLTLFISVLPILGIEYFGTEFYSRSSVCLPLHLTKEKTPGWEYSVVIFLGVNAVSFILVVICYVTMYFSTRRVFARSGRSREVLSFPAKLSLIVGTDMVCWLPIIVIQGAALNGADIPGVVYSWIAVLILPVNAALNPIIYTLSTLGAKHGFGASTSRETRSSSIRSGQLMRLSSLGTTSPTPLLPMSPGACSVMIADDDFLRPNFLPYPMDLVFTRGGEMTRLDSCGSLTVSQIHQIALGVISCINSLHDEDILHYRINEQYVYLYTDRDKKMQVYLQRGLHKLQAGNAYKTIDILQFAELIQRLLDNANLTPEM